MIVARCRVTSLSSEDPYACLQCVLDAQVMIPSSVQAALVSARISLGRRNASPCQLSSILRCDQGMAHVTFSDVVSTRQVDVVGGYIAERQRTRMEWICTTAFNSYFFPLIEDGERDAMGVATACKMFGDMWTPDAEEIDLSDSAMTILCDMLAAWKLLQVLSSMDFTLLDEEVWTDLAAIPLRAKVSSKLMDVLVVIHVEDSSFYKATHASPCRGMRRAWLRTRW